MFNLIFSLCCFMLFEQVVSHENVLNSVTAQSFFNGDTLLIERHSVNSSDIKVLMTDRTITKIYVYVANTFYANEDLKLNGITELQISANTWNITQPVTFDLSGLDGSNRESIIVKGTAGKYGNAGMKGGNFFAWANEIINGEHLTVISNGGNGGDGQDAIASDDINVTFNKYSDIGESGWFSTADLHKYYERYFSDRGYDPDIGRVNDYTSFYALFVHDKKASFNVRLHPRKCCGTTGEGGAGGIGGRSGTVILKYAGDSTTKKTPESTPESTAKFIANYGSVGKFGKDAKTCKSLALDVRIDTELEKVVFIFLPLHHSFSSHFTVLNHINSSKCSPEFVKSELAIVVEVREIETVSPFVRYKRFLIENMKNESLKNVIQRAYEAIDENTEINDEYSLDALVMEACELEKNYFELKKLVDLVSMYQRLSKRIKSLERLESHRLTENDRIALSRLGYILSMKLANLREYDDSLIVNIDLFTEVVAEQIKTKNELVLPNLNISDVELRNDLELLQFGFYGNYFLDTYYHIIEGFQLTFFPFAVDYLKMYRLPTSFLSYEDLNAIALATTNNLNTLSQSIDAINSNRARIVKIKNSIDQTNREDAFYTWKNYDVREKIRKLFAGEKITLLADVKQTKNRFNSIKFNTIELVFRLSELSQQNDYFNDRLNYILEILEVKFNHTGVSTFRCNDNFYQMTTEPIFILSSFAKGTSKIPLSRNLVYDMLRENRPVLSPFTLWEIQLSGVNEHDVNFDVLEPFVELVDIELHGTGKYIRENASICENENLAKFYSLMEN